MHDAELEYWGRYGRAVNEETAMLLSNPPGLSRDVMQLWNVIGALEEKVRNASQ